MEGPICWVYHAIKNKRQSNPDNSTSRLNHEFQPVDWQNQD